VGRFEGQIYWFLSTSLLVTVWPQH